ncbi:unnamed protein product [Polarella glacialis]|uniref:Uncharacterized protein n=1 Tax=Polarella glacialis TaxID=89957 RepID=A0A813GTA5_POLGL|nr:unnamed protein product [Polarella glacialis]CAE8685851.1 unnamed protein product [Polarella glacialis]
MDSAAPTQEATLVVSAPKRRERRGLSRIAEGKSAAEAKKRPSQRRPLADDHATQQLLKDLLCNKQVVDDSLIEDPGAEVRPAGKALSRNGAPAVASARDPPAADWPSTPADSCGLLPPMELRSPMELEKERQDFMNKVCSETTRFDVRDWIDKIFNMEQRMKADALMRDAKDKRRRRLRSSSAASDSGLSGQTGYTGASATTALQTVGGSIAGPKPPKSVVSDESLVVHHSKGDEPLSIKERIQAFLENRIPELSEHIESHIAKHTEEVQKEVDSQVAEQFLRATSQRQVFDNRVNYLRWQNARHQALQQRIDAKMSKWIVEAIETWDQRKAAESRPKEVNETDLIFDYLTKRASHIDSGKLPSKIPVFKTLHSSYSLPSMWRDKY